MSYYGRCDNKIIVKKLYNKPTVIHDDLKNVPGVTAPDPRFGTGGGGGKTMAGNLSLGIFGASTFSPSAIKYSHQMIVDPTLFTRPIWCFSSDRISSCCI